MIKDKLLNAESYYAISKKLQTGFEWLKNSNLKDLEEGKYLIDGENIFANVQNYTTKDSAPYETHKKYIDIQYMIKGEEKICITEKNNCIIVENYNPNKDVEFLDCKNIYDEHILREGDFMVFFPQDAHQPSLKIKNNLPIKKVIVKVSI